MNLFLILATLPSVAVAYMMICRLNEKKRHILSMEGWAYLLFLGGAISTFVTAISSQLLPGTGKLLLDFGLCLYFGQRSFRGHIWRKRRNGKH